MDVSQQVQRVMERIRQAALAAGREPGEITLCAATKVQTDETIRAAIAAGVRVCGENRVQELAAHLAADAYAGAEQVHFIGHLQTNKVKQVVGHVDLIQSVGSAHLLQAIQNQADKQGIIQDILLEVNIGQEESKGGCMPQEAEALARQAMDMSAVRLRGLMAIPPVNDDDAQNRRYLAAVHDLFVKAGERGYSNVEMQTLSMGMSGDYENAIREGATLVRIGTAIYGERDYSKK